MDLYTVKLKSKDKNSLEFLTKASCVLDAEFKAFKYIEEQGWTHHQYKTQEVIVENVKGKK